MLTAGHPIGGPAGEDPSGVLKLPIEPDDLRRLVEVEGLSLAEVARRLGVTKRRVELAARRHGIESQHVRPRRDELHDERWLREQFDAGKSITEVAETLCEPETVRSPAAWGQRPLGSREL